MTATLDRDSPVPLYAQIEDIIRHKIVNGEWQPGERIPSEAKLNERFGVARMTLRGVLNGLVDEGLLYRVPGKGTFVAERKIATMSPAYRGIREQLEEQGFSTTTELVHAITVPATDRVRRALGVGEGEPVHDIMRRRLVEGEPVSLHHSFVPVRMAPGLSEQDVVGEQLCIILERTYQLRAWKTVEQLEAVPATAQEALLLDLRPGDPLLLLEDAITERTGTIFEYSKILFRGDRMKLHFEFTT